MKEAFVVDASVAMSWAVPSQGSESAAQLLDQIAEGRPFVVPEIWTVEVANALLALKRRKRITTQEWKLARTMLGGLNATIGHDAGESALHGLSDLAEKYGLSVYDAAYLELAMRLRAPLATRDAALSHAAAACGIERLLTR